MEILNWTMMWLLCLPCLEQKELLSPIRLMLETFQLDFTQHHHQETFLWLKPAKFLVLVKIQRASQVTQKPVTSN